jgi:hypothetical protein
LFRERRLTATTTTATSPVNKQQQWQKVLENDFFNVKNQIWFALNMKTRVKMMSFIYVFTSLFFLNASNDIRQALPSSTLLFIPKPPKPPKPWFPALE